MPPDLRRSRGASAFTLIEMIVASSILALILVICLSVVNGMSLITLQTSQRNDVTQTARESLDQMGRELSVAAQPCNRFNVASAPQLLVDPSGVLPSVAATNSDSIFWQAPLSRSGSNGNLSIVGYLVISDTNESNSASWRFQLRRVYIDPSSPSYSLYSAGTGPWLTQAMVTSFAQLTTSADVANALQGWVADGVLGMWLRFLDKSGNPIIQSAYGTKLSSIGTYYDSRQAYSETGTNAQNYNAYSYPYLHSKAPYYSALPAFIEVTLVCMAPSEIVRLRPPLPPLPQSSQTQTTLQFIQSIQTFMQSVRSNNQGGALHTVQSFTRRFRMYITD
jgi:prepilin-type N-terminal cleavage/methylation domain-containing protein